MFQSDGKKLCKLFQSDGKKCGNLFQSDGKIFLGHADDADYQDLRRFLRVFSKALRRISGFDPKLSKRPTSLSVAFR